MKDYDEGGFQNEVIGSERPVLVEFWSTWCASCKQQEAIMAELEADYGDRVSFGKVKMDDNQNLAIQYSIMSAPTVMLFAGGEMKKRFYGLQKRIKLQEAIDQVLSAE